MTPPSRGTARLPCLPRSAGQPEIRPRCEASFERSTFKAFAFEGDELVGFGRTVDDGRFYAILADVVVAPAWQRRGVGTAIVQDLQSRLKGFRMVTLTATPEVQPFYGGWAGVG